MNADDTQIRRTKAITRYWILNTERQETNDDNREDEEKENSEEENMNEGDDFVDDMK